MLCGRGAGCSRPPRRAEPSGALRGSLSRVRNESGAARTNVAPMSTPARRKFLIAAAATAGAAGIAGTLLWHRRSADEHAAHVELPPFRDPEFPNPLRLPGSEGMYGVLDAADAFTMVAKPVRHALLPGRPGAMLAYEVEHHCRTLR